MYVLIRPGNFVVACVCLLFLLCRFFLLSFSTLVAVHSSTQLKEKRGGGGVVVMVVVVRNLKISHSF